MSSNIPTSSATDTQHEQQKMQSRDRNNKPPIFVLRHSTSKKHEVKPLLKLLCQISELHPNAMNHHQPVNLENSGNPVTPTIFYFRNQKKKHQKEL